MTEGISDDVEELPQVGDLVVDAEIRGAGNALGVIPAAREAVIVGALDVAGERIADDDAVLAGDAVNVGKDIVEIIGAGLGSPCLLTDEGIGDVGDDGAAAQALTLDGGHGVGDEVERMGAAQLTADLLGVGQQHIADAEGGEMGMVAALGRALEADGGEEITIALDNEEILGHLATVEGRPHTGIALLVGAEVLLRVGDVMLRADGGEGGAVGLIEVEEGIVRVKE